ncbi:MAG: pyruvate kinase [Deltaproteobacteria bacterium]|nr:pyruvate kinase [Deltaproteobacteria bacterium]
MSGRRVMRKTKIVATVGPACSDPDTLTRMIEAGMNVARFNFSHESHEGHAERLEMLRNTSSDLGVPVATMLDTKGAEVRTGTVQNGEVRLEVGKPFALFAGDELGDASGVSVSFPDLVRQVGPGASIRIDDGRLELRVESNHPDELRCVVVRGGELGNHKGINVPGAPILVDGLNEANQADLRFAVEHGIDYIAASFMQRPEDVQNIRRFLRECGGSIPIIAKIENREGLNHLDGIVAAANGTMVARGDLGVELAPAEVPAVQKRIIRTTVGSGKPTITATQMLDSMERNPQPTRAEASDVANAILDGSSAVMLSGETARGRHPVEAVRTMSELALGAEESLGEYGYLQQISPHPTALVTEAISQAAITMADHLKAAAILTLTESGFTSRQISKYRPACPIIAVTRSRDVVRRLAMNWGVTATFYDGDPADEKKVDAGVAWALSHGMAEPGDVVVVTAGISSEAGSTNMIRIITVT